MKVEDGMSLQVLTIGPAHTIREAARMMHARQVGAAVVVDPDDAGVGILTERDILRSVAADENPDTEMAGDHCTQDVVGLLSMRDIVRCWSAARVPAQAGAPEGAQAGQRA